jgi:glutaredoxin
MNVVLLTGNDCQPCHQVEEAFKKKFKDEIESGEADIVNLDEDEQAQKVWAENDLPLAPTIIVISDKMKVISVLDPSQLLEEA